MSIDGAKLTQIEELMTQELFESSVGIHTCTHAVRLLNGNTHMCTHAARLLNGNTHMGTHAARLLNGLKSLLIFLMGIHSLFSLR